MNVHRFSITSYVIIHEDLHSLSCCQRHILFLDRCCLKLLFCSILLFFSSFISFCFLFFSFAVSRVFCNMTFFCIKVGSFGFASFHLRVIFIFPFVKCCSCQAGFFFFHATGAMFAHSIVH